MPGIGLGVESELEEGADADQAEQPRRRPELARRETRVGGGGAHGRTLTGVGGAGAHLRLVSRSVKEPMRHLPQPPSPGGLGVVSDANQRSSEAVSKASAVPKLLLLVDWPLAVSVPVMSSRCAHQVRARSGEAADIAACHGEPSREGFK